MVQNARKPPSTGLLRLGASDGQRLRLASRGILEKHQSLARQTAGATFDFNYYGPTVVRWHCGSAKMEPYPHRNMHHAVWWMVLAVPVSDLCGPRSDRDSGERRSEASMGRLLCPLVKRQRPMLAFCAVRVRISELLGQHQPCAVRSTSAPHQWFQQTFASAFERQFIRQETEIDMKMKTTPLP